MSVISAPSRQQAQALGQPVDRVLRPEDADRSQVETVGG
jgi:hypothetical protein